MLLNSKFHFTSFQVKMKCIASPAILDQVLIGNASAAQTQIFKNLMQPHEVKQKRSGLRNQLSRSLLASYLNLLMTRLIESINGLFL